MIQTLLTIAITCGVGLFTLIFGYIIFRRGLHIPSTDEVLVIVSKSKKTVSAEEIDGDVVESIRERRDDTTGFRISKGTIWVNPITSKVFPLKVDSRKTTFKVSCYDKNKVALDITGEILFKIGDSDQAIKAAAKRFMNTKPEELNNTVEGLSTGQLRALAGEMTISELIGDRQAVASRVKDQVFTDMALLGLQVDAVVLREITDDNKFIENLGVPESERVNQEASIARDQARRERERATQEAELEIARVRRDTEVEAAKYAAERDRAKATAEQAGPLARAEAEVTVIEKETAVAQKRAAMKEQLLDAEVRKAADAEAYRIEQIANANKKRVELEAEAESTRISSIGSAEAQAFEEKGKALAGEHGESIIQQKLVEQMPQIVRAASEPYAAIDNMVIADPDNLGEAIIAAISSAGKAVQTARGLSEAKDVKSKLPAIEEHKPESSFDVGEGLKIPSASSIELPETNPYDNSYETEDSQGAGDYQEPIKGNEEHVTEDQDLATEVDDNGLIDSQDLELIFNTVEKVRTGGVAAFLSSSGEDLPRLISLFNEIKQDKAKLQELDVILTPEQVKVLNKLMKRF